MIHTPERAKQVIDFEGLSYEKLHPTDIDAVLEFDDKYLILIETKSAYCGEMPRVEYGQELAYHRIADAWAKVNEGAFVIYTTHNTKPDETVYLKDTIVHWVYNANSKHKTYYDNGDLKTLKEWLKTLLPIWDCEKLRSIVKSD